MVHLKKMNFLFLALPLVCSCDYIAEVETKAKNINNYERVALSLVKENKELETEISRLKFELEGLKTKNSYLSMQLEETKAGSAPVKMVGRNIASVAMPDLTRPKQDLVEFSVYKWDAKQLLMMAQAEFKAKNFEKSAQHFMEFSNNYSSHELYNDDFLFQAGLAAFETGHYNDWSKKYFLELIERYPKSSHYRSAKLWNALINLREGNTNEFFGTVEEFRLKYRNTPEWKTLSAKYEEIVQRYKN